MAYAKAQLDPFDAGLQEMLPCIPDAQEVLSYKFATNMRGRCQIGSAQYGHIFMNPRVPFNDQNYLMYTTSGYAGTDVTPIPSIAGSGVAMMTNARSPFNSAAPVGVRPVGSGLRIRYIGTELERGGVIVALSTPDFNSSYAGQTPAQLETKPEAKVYQVDRKWKTVAARYSVVPSYTNSTANTIANGSVMGFLLFGTAGNMFEWETVTYYESISTAAFSVPTTSKSDSDIVGISVVRDFAASVLPSEAGSHLIPKLLSFLKKGASMAMSAIIPGSGEVFDMLTS